MRSQILNDRMWIKIASTLTFDFCRRYLWLTWRRPLCETWLTIWATTFFILFADRYLSHHFHFFIWLEWHIYDDQNHIHGPMGSNLLYIFCRQTSVNNCSEHIVFYKMHSFNSDLNFIFLLFQNYYRIYAWFSKQTWKYAWSKMIQLKLWQYN